MPKKKVCTLEFPAEADQQPAPPGQYEVRYYVRGNPVPLAVSDPIVSRWPSVHLNCTHGQPLRMRFQIDVAHCSAAHVIRLCLISDAHANGGEIGGHTQPGATDTFSIVDSVPVVAGMEAGEVSFQGSHIQPGTYIGQYHMSPEYDSLRLASTRSLSHTLTHALARKCALNHRKYCCVEWNN